MFFTDESIVLELINSTSSNGLPISTSTSTGTSNNQILITNIHHQNSGIHRFTDGKDEIDKLMSTSPPLIISTLFPYDNHYDRSSESNSFRSSITYESIIAENDDLEKLLKLKSNDEEDINKSIFKKRESIEKTKGLKSDNDIIMTFKPIPIPQISTTRQSSLSALLSSHGIVDEKLGNVLSLQIFLPNKVEPFSLLIQENNTVHDVIMKILLEKQQEFVLPYQDCSMYELRMHEGDGEPDMDFPAFDKNMTIIELNNTSQSTEFCLCTCNHDDNEDDSDDEFFNPTHELTRKGSRFTGEEDKNRNSVISMISKDNENVVTIVIPNAGNTLIEYNDNMKLRDLLPLLAKKIKLRLYIDEYIFSIFPDEQKRLKLASPIIDLETNIKYFGVKQFQLEKKQYADVIRSHSNARKKLEQQKQNSDRFFYTELTAPLYQEWNVIKKNKFGRKQSRIIGIDGMKIYNSRPKNTVGGLSIPPSPSGVHRATRDLSIVKAVDIINDIGDTISNTYSNSGDYKTFRITFDENKNVYDMEYTCENSNACREIVAKLKFLLKR